MKDWFIELALVATPWHWKLRFDRPWTWMWTWQLGPLKMVAIRD